MMREQPVPQSLENDEDSYMCTSLLPRLAKYKRKLVIVTVKLNMMREQPVRQSIENDDSYMSTSLPPRLANYKRKLVIVTVKLQFYHRKEVRPAYINGKEVQVSIPFPQHIFKSQQKGGLSHCYKSKTNSSRRTQHMMNHLTQSNNDWYLKLTQDKTYKNIHKVINRRVNTDDHIKYHGKNIVFSAKKTATENMLFETPSNYEMVNLFETSKIKKIMTVNGSICFLNRQFVYLLLPRHEVLEGKFITSFVKEMKDLETKLQTSYSPRGHNKHVMYEGNVANYVTLGLTSCRFAKGLYTKVIDGNKTINNNLPVKAFTHFVGDKCKKYIPTTVFDNMNKSLNDIQVRPFTEIGTFKEETTLNEDPTIHDTSTTKGTKESWSGKEHSILPSIAFGRNTILPMHTDEDAFLSVVSVHCKEDIDNRTNSYRNRCSISKFFTFDNSISVGLRSGDLLIFNPTVGHCISTLTDEYRNRHVYCVSHYFKSKVVSLNDNSIPFEKII